MAEAPAHDGAGAAAATGDELDALRAAVTKQAGVVKSMKAEGKPQVSEDFLGCLVRSFSCMQARVVVAQPACTNSMTTALCKMYFCGSWR